MNPITTFGVIVLILACQVSCRPQDNAAVAVASPPTKEGNVTLLKNDIKPLDGQGGYSYDIELSDGTKLVQSGHTEAPVMGETEPSIVIEGSYSYLSPDGKQISITYVADKNGFQPKGDSIPTQGPAVNGAASPAGAAPPVALAAAAAPQAAAASNPQPAVEAPAANDHPAADAPAQL